MQHLCPVCESTGQKFNQYYIQCRACGLLFAPDRKCDPDLFSEAYAGHKSEAAMEAFASRMQLAPLLHRAPVARAVLSTSAHQEALEFLKAQLAPGSYVLDLGCGPGRFLRVLREAGFRALGCDIARAPVEFLQSQGFQVYLGSVDEYPHHWPKPKAVTSFFVLHHVENPVEFLKGLHSRFPRSVILIAEYYDKGVNLELPQSRPPRTLTIWTPKALQLALTKAGYQKIIIKPTKSVPSEVSMPGAQKVYISLRRFIPLPVLTFYFMAKRLLWPYALWLRLRGHGFAVLGIAEPD